jgi:hypothetical protein
VGVCMLGTGQGLATSQGAFWDAHLERSCIEKTDRLVSMGLDERVISMRVDADIRSRCSSCRSDRRWRAALAESRVVSRKR